VLNTSCTNRRRLALGIFLWIAGLGLLIYGAFFGYSFVLDKPLSVDKARTGVSVKAMHEIALTAAVSTDQVELNEDGMLQTRPSTGFCET